MNQSRWWTDESELKQRLDTAREPKQLPGPLLDGALSEWQRTQRRDLSLVGKPGSASSAARMRARGFVEQQLAWPADSSALHPQPLSRHVHDDYVEEQALFTTTAPMRAPATVLVPRGVSGPCPGIVALHDMGGFRLFGRQKLLAFDGEPECLTAFRQQHYHGASIMADLVRRGYVVVAIDQLCFGERTMAAADDPVGFRQRRLEMDAEAAQEFTAGVSRQDEPFLVRQVMTVGRTWPGLVVADDRRTVDYLCSRPEVDPTRIGCIGLSFGAYRANYLGALDDRIKAAVSVCWTSTMDGLVGYNVGGAMGWFSLIPGMFERMDLPDLQALTAPRAFMAINGWHDHLVQPFGIAKAHLHLRESFTLAGCPEQLGSLL
ncbi:MAG: dienelactone hydrolase family protein, partial [Armatimonadota bacterium]